MRGEGLCLTSTTSDPFADPEAISQLPLRERLRANRILIQLGISLAWESSRAMTITLFAMMLIQAALTPLQLFLTGITIDSIVAHPGGGVPGSGWSARFSPTTWILITAGTIMLGQLMEPVRTFVQTMLGDRTTVHTGDRLLAATNRWHGVERFENPKTADDLNLAGGRGVDVGVNLLMQGGPLVGFALTSVALCVTIGALHPLVPMLLIVATLPQLIDIYEFQNRVFSHIAWQIPAARRLHYTHQLPIAPGEAKDYRLFELGDRTLERYDLIWNDVTASLDAVRETLLRKQTRATVLSQIVSAVVVVFVILRASRGEVSIGQVTLYTGAIAMLNANLVAIGSAFGYVPRILAFLPALQRVLDAPADLPVPEHPASLKLPLRRGIAFENVSFTYPGTETPVLRHVSFTLDPGESVALVGHNGAGKTTLIKLLLRLYDPDEGRITLDGVDIRDYHPDDLRRACSVIFQDFGRYHFTARENIAIGDIGATLDDECLQAAITKAGGEGVIETLPDGLETMLGLRFGGRDLSGGEWQKIALARAFVRDAPSTRCTSASPT